MSMTRNRSMTRGSMKQVTNRRSASARKRQHGWHRLLLRSRAIEACVRSKTEQLLQAASTQYGVLPQLQRFWQKLKFHFSYGWAWSVRHIQAMLQGPGAQSIRQLMAWASALHSPTMPAVWVIGHAAQIKEPYHKPIGAVLSRGALVVRAKASAWTKAMLADGARREGADRDLLRYVAAFDKLYWDYNLRLFRQNNALARSAGTEKQRAVATETVALMQTYNQNVCKLMAGISRCLDALGSGLLEETQFEQLDREITSAALAMPVARIDKLIRTNEDICQGLARWHAITERLQTTNFTPEVQAATEAMLASLRPALARLSVTKQLLTEAKLTCEQRLPMYEPH